MKVIVFGGDGFCGWPTALHLSSLGHDVTIVDNLSRRRIDDELGLKSLTPIASMPDRLRAWQELQGRPIEFVEMDMARDISGLDRLLGETQPDAVVHFAEQRAAPYSMRGPEEKRYTVDNNISATHHLLVALVERSPDTHLVHLGTMGVYGYSGGGFSIPEGYLDVAVRDEEGELQQREILFPTSPGSVYHMTKSLDQLMFQFYARNDRLKITDLHQGIVWGTQTDLTMRDERLINRFDYDGDYGTVLNRFLVESAIGYPLTVHGSGGQTRAFINIGDTVRCVALAIENPPERGERVNILNQVAETLRVIDLAELVSKRTGAEIAHVPNPRAEADENELVVSNEGFRSLGLDPILLDSSLLQDTIDLSRRYRDRIDREKIPARSAWNAERQREIDGDMAIA
ncbi:NAD-dependent epimerase/dehydratase family protein [Alteraurantiacibacter aquimixticola]|uniref:NAD-dependent epimerase/dehydratase family protein n=1 Tax=Alteraurantiacibacter aquimixticola TaxID=2489173 RepID=A0A4T3F0W6_9SPHN|nr:NAD-dependent epimerase/dehydratase family protein [Alteraurantiacibacter aquimixticola]TIX50699.1 NAD-dependent epimerase/dehydratase family protein [Alteraurantiacibacter aquimixticola]